MVINSISGNMFRKMILNGAKLIDINKEHVDALNVFPVPDGDTGTNMSLTMLSAAKEVSACQSNKMEAICDALSKGALRGARGNSGVILSQILKGMATAMAVNETITAKSFAKGLEKGAAVAYKAVTKPKEGTILTVIKAMSEFATKNAKRNMDIEQFIKDVLEAGEESLRLTPELLPILKKAGVVDAGGRGLLVILQGFYNVIAGVEEENIEFDDKVNSDASSKFSEEAHFDIQDLSDIEFAYCTEFFIINMHKWTTEADIDRFREKLMTIGDCVLVIGDLSMVKVHVHSNQPGVVLTHALELGELDKLKIENMLEQNRALLGKKKEELKPYGLVSVCAGEGLAAIFKDLLVDNIIEGGQTMNPSADDIARACDSIPAENIFVFPNNKNIILAAEQAKKISKRKLTIIPTVNVPQGLSAVLAFNPEDTLKNNIDFMTEAINGIRAGMVTYAVRSTNINDMELKEGDIIGIDKDIVAKGIEVKEVTTELIDKMMTSDVSNITLYFGNNVKEEEANDVAEELTQKYKRCDVDVHFGGQPLYYYIVSLE
ncbi:MAG: DAK2 domain-containing protein [Clostridiales bacterium]|nr:DAK2 domain-containing protein [Clostridiales bacterium]